MNKNSTFVSELEKIFSSLSIWMIDNENTIPLKIGLLKNSKPLHRSVVAHIFLDILTPNGTNMESIFGLITKPIPKEIVVGLEKAAEFNTDKGRRFIWLYPEDIEYVKITIPSKIDNIHFDEQSPSSEDDELENAA